MPIREKSSHDNCSVQIVVKGSSIHYAYLECCDLDCKRKQKHIQWISKHDAEFLEGQGVSVVDVNIIGHY